MGAGSSQKMELQVRGNVLIGLINDTPVLNCIDNSGLMKQSGGAPGIHAQGGNIWVDDFEAGNASDRPMPTNLPAQQEMF